MRKGSGIKVKVARNVNTQENPEKNDLCTVTKYFYFVTIHD